jgi:long-chain-fatty-acid--luciferin-component ligase
MRNIFEIKTEEDFEEACLSIFNYQYENIDIYHQFVDYLNINPKKISKITEIPFLPIEMFKHHTILDRNRQTDAYFQSSGTTNIQTLSRHWIADFELYQQSILHCFQQFIGHPKDYIFLGLLPNYLERQNSSLIYMVDFLMNKSSQKENGYFLYNHPELLELLKNLNNRKIILFGVSFALLDFIDFCEANGGFYSAQNSNLIIIETGGMKGRKEEMTKDELLKILRNGFLTDKIYSEYSMTELLSQAYSLGNNIYQSPNWLRIMIRNLEDPFSYVEKGKTGAVNIIDLANKYSCSFIATQDLGKSFDNHQFQILGRIDHSDIRGCSLLVTK